MSRDEQRTTDEQTPTRLSISFFPRQLEWLQKEAEREGISVAEVVRRLAEAAASAEPTAAPAPTSAEPELPRFEPVPESLPAAVEAHHALPLAAEALGVDLAVVLGWLDEDPELSRRVDEARWKHVLGVQARLLALGRGEAKGQRQALQAFLEAHHPAFGRVKAELVRRQLRPWCAKVVRLLTEVLGVDTDAGRHTLTTFRERLAALQQDAERDFT